jgi:hypothetical protein
VMAPELGCNIVATQCDPYRGARLIPVG